MHAGERVGVLLINTGSTAAPEPGPTRRYLREFLSDPRVLDISPIARSLLLNLVILPFRPKRSAEAYASVWMEDGSPLLVLSRRQRDGLRQRLPEAVVEMAMRYGEPSIPAVLDGLLQQDLDRILGRVTLGTAGPRDPVALGQSLRALPAAAEALGVQARPTLRATVAAGYLDLAKNAQEATSKVSFLVKAADHLGDVPADLRRFAVELLELRAAQAGVPPLRARLTESPDNVDLAHNLATCRRLAQRLDELIEEHRRLWLERSWPGGLPSSCQYYERISADLPSR